MRTWNEQSEQRVCKAWNFRADAAELFSEFPEEIKRWLTQLYLLNNLPFPYLVPDEKLLPPDSARFFYLDHNWLLALADGAASIGRNTAYDVAIDSYAKGMLHEQSLSELRTSRLGKMHDNHRRYRGREDAITADSVLTGFLMRSELVTHWKGIELKGYQGSSLLKILRMDVLSGRIMLCIFDGDADRVELLEPAEALHFGTKAKDREIRVRAITGDQVGKTVGTATVPVCENGRVKIKKFASELSGKLGVKEDAITSAELALQLICVADQCEFKRKEPGEANE